VIIDNTRQLHRWLRSLGSSVEVLEPADLPRLSHKKLA
jgi:hypothetical protein